MSHPPTPSSGAAAFLAAPHRAHIGGRFVEPNGGTLIDVENPSHAAVVSHVEAATPADITAAVVAARSAFTRSWGIMAGADRARIMFRFADLLEQHAELIGEIESIDAGTPIALSVPTVRDFCAGLIRYYAGWATKIEGSTFPAVAHGRADQELLVYTLREPVGVVAAIVPWNAPAAMIVLKMGAALAAGCTMVLKTAELAPLSGEMLATLWTEAGGPPGSFNVLHGTGRDTGAALVRHPGINKVTFTGSTEVGRDIVSAVAGDLRRVTLELGGKSPFIVFPDAPMDEAVPAAAMACFFLSGQNCMAGSRLFLHNAIHDSFVDVLVQFSGQLVLGDALDSATMLGPVISAPHRRKIAAFVAGAAAEPGVAIHAAGIPPGEGYFVVPTIVTGVQPGMSIAQDEIFGPVLAVQRFGDDEDALAEAVGAVWGGEGGGDALHGEPGEDAGGEGGAGELRGAGFDRVSGWRLGAAAGGQPGAV